MSAIFVTGTDTNAGKTHLCGLLLDFLLKEGITAGYQKWAATGPESPPADLVSCLRTAGVPIVPAMVSSQVVYHFELPASPHLAAEREGKGVDPELIRNKYREMLALFGLLVVEGVGGVMVPLRRDLLLIDLLAELKIPCLVVARSGLGTINHTLLTLEALNHRNLPVLGVVLSDGAPDEDEVLVADNARTIGEMGRVAVFGRLPYAFDAAQAKNDFAPVGQAILNALKKTSVLSPQK